MNEMKQLVALYKTYRGGEWFEASLESVHKHCAGVVVVASDKPWIGVGGDSHPPENCQAPLERFRQKHPSCETTLIRPGMRLETHQQYRIGLDFIGRMYGPECGVLIVDTDEVWDSDELLELRLAMTEDKNSAVFRSRIWTYLRSPLYRVFPQEKARPVVGLANSNVTTGNSRFANLHALGHQVGDIDCDMHHFGYVRLDPEEIVSKLANTASQDKVTSRADWKQEVWDELPEGENLHPAKGFERCWGGVKEITADDLPSAVVESPTFWAALAYHRERLPNDLLLAPDEDWRIESEQDQVGVETTVGEGFELCLSAALPKLGQDTAIFLTPRLRMSLRETMQLGQHAKAMPVGGTALEIGSGMGGSLAVIGKCSPAKTKLVAVDPFEPYDEENLTISVGTAVSSVEEFRETMSKLGLSPTLFQAPSSLVRENIKADYVAIYLLLVDGNHSYSHALHDLTAWWDLLRPGGTLLLHDFSGRFPGAVKAAKEFETTTGLRFNLPRRSTLAWLKKPG